MLGRYLNALVVTLLLFFVSPNELAAETYIVEGVFSTWQDANRAVKAMPIDSSFAGGFCCGRHREGQRAYYLFGWLNGNRISYYAYWYRNGSGQCPSGTTQYSDGSCHPQGRQEKF